MTGEFPTQMANNAENVSIWWRHHEAERFLIPRSVCIRYRHLPNWFCLLIDALLYKPNVINYHLTLRLVSSCEDTRTCQKLRSSELAASLKRKVRQGFSPDIHWGRWSQASGNVSSEYQGWQPDELSVSVYTVQHSQGKNTFQEAYRRPRFTLFIDFYRPNWSAILRNTLLSPMPLKTMS